MLRIKVLRVTLLASVAALALTVAWATTGASANCRVVEIAIPYSGHESLSSDDCRDPLESEDYADIYGVWLDAAYTVDITLVSDNFRPVVSLLDDRGADLEWDNNDGRKGAARIVRTLPKGEYQIVATDFNEGRGTGSYELRVTAKAYSCTPIEIEDLPDDGRASLSSSDCRDPLDLADYADIYSLQLNAQSDVFVGLASTNFIPVVHLLDDHGASLAWDNNDENEGTARIVRTLPKGDYQIVATDYSAGRGAGSYNLRVTASERSGDSVAGPCSDPNPNNSWHGAGSRDTAAVHGVKRLITRALFLIRGGDVVHCASADYNDFGEEPGIGPGYEGGHAGWDVQTTNVAFGATANVPFYSLTAGTVAYINDALGAIGVDDGKNTVYYFHARHRYVDMGQQVAVGEPLGIQGNAGLGFSNPSTQEHVHIEVHRNQERPHNFRGAVNAPGRGGTDSLLLWHEQLNYLCAESSDRWRQLVSSGQCEPLDEIKAPSPHP